jgi:hypothetical protein
MGWVFRRFWDVVLIAALLAVLGGAALMQSAAGTGGNALGQGISGGFTFVKSIAGGFRDANTVGNALKAPPPAPKEKKPPKGPKAPENGSRPAKSAAH